MVRTSIAVALSALAFVTIAQGQNDPGSVPYKGDLNAKPCLPVEAGGAGTSFKWNILPAGTVISFWCGSQVYAFAAKPAWKPVRYPDPTQLAVEIGRLRVLDGYSGDRGTFMKNELATQVNATKPKSSL